MFILWKEITHINSTWDSSWVIRKRLSYSNLMILYNQCRLSKALKCYKFTHWLKKLNFNDFRCLPYHLKRISRWRSKRIKDLPIPGIEPGTLWSSVIRSPNWAKSASYLLGNLFSFKALVYFNIQMVNWIQVCLPAYGYYLVFSNFSNQIDKVELF